jgi:hypothetical protein
LALQRRELGKLGRLQQQRKLGLARQLGKPRRFVRPDACSVASSPLIGRQLGIVGRLQFFLGLFLARELGIFRRKLQLLRLRLRQLGIVGRQLVQLRRLRRPLERHLL